ncbi:MAG: DUF1493 family protein [Trinickia sp.]
MKTYTWEDLESFIRKEGSVSEKKIITPDSTITDDLGQQGDDADAFMQHFFESFEIDKGDYDFQRYFLREREGIAHHLLMKLLRKTHTFKREALTVGMLHRALIPGKWDARELARHSSAL